MKEKKLSGCKGTAPGLQIASGAEATHLQGESQPSKKINAFPRPRNDEVVVCPIGGVRRIGMNWTLYGHDGSWILVDAGSAFVKDVPGVAGVIPDPHNLPKIDAILLTHAHEDHIGALHHLWDRLDCDVYATPFAATLLAGRLREKNHEIAGRIRTFRPGEEVLVGCFRVETIPVTHSMPECVAMAIRTPAGTILHTGDWKLDDEPLVGQKTDIERVRKIGDEGVLAMLCDSTNADRDAPVTTEASVARNFVDVFKKRTGAIVVSCFATNVARLVGIGLAAAKTGRQVALVGRSMVKVEAAAREVGLIGDDLPFLAEANHLKGLDKRQMVIVCTGTQGEERAALSKLAFGLARQLPHIEAGDTVIHSARAIPGNQEAIELVMEKFRDRYVEVLMAKDGDRVLHVTGHAGRGELMTMYGLVRPRFAIPVHGEPQHMAAHAELASSAGCEESALTQEGSVLAISKRGIRDLGRVRVDHLAIIEGDGAGLQPFDLTHQELIAVETEVAA